MIISVSRRTDIPAFYSDWFFNRLKAGYVITINPYNQHIAHRVSLKPEDVTCFVFWTKNPTPFLKRLDELKGYQYYFQFTLNAYGTDLEPFVPNKNQLVQTFQILSNVIGKEKVIWRYDPILINDYYTKEYHYYWFDKLCAKLSPFTNKCIISFIDVYKKIENNFKKYHINNLSEEEMIDIAKTFQDIAHKYNLILETCSENVNLYMYGINHGKCIDDQLIAKLINDPKLHIKKDQYQRKECGCAVSVDIGTYNTCPHQCIYCYANYRPNVISKNYQAYVETSAVLLGKIDDATRVYVKKFDK